VRGNLGEIVDHLAAFGFPDARDEAVKRLTRLTLFEIPLRDSIHGLGNALRRHGADRQAVRAGVLGPLPAEHDLKMRDRVPVLVPADPVEAEVGDVMLPARIEAAADLDVESADG